MTDDWRLFRKVTLPLSALNLINQASRTVMAIIGPVLAVERVPRDDISSYGVIAFDANARLGDGIYQVRDLVEACMFVSYAVAQRPDGVALDVLGPRRV